MATIMAAKSAVSGDQSIDVVGDKRRTKAHEHFDSEADLCSLFIREFNQLPGWTCYPECAGFDVLVVHEDGRQIGVEAKLTLNVKVADQILPVEALDFYSRPGPDYRLVIVGRITDSSAGLRKMLERFGVQVLVPRISHTSRGDEATFDLEHRLLEAKGQKSMFGRLYLFDWNPEERCRLPAMVTSLPAGVPSPVRLTPWKESALKVLALLRKQGFITARQIAAYGVAITRWTQPVGNTPAWLSKGEVRGQWVESKFLPAFDIQHPEVYALAVQMLEKKLSEELTLSRS